MTDRELLELAAKAAGIDGRIKEWVNAGPDFIRPEGDVWNPLEDDGDALRLAVKLRIQIDPLPKQVFVGWGFRTHTPQRNHEKAEFYKDDEMAATRRCIVMAAAELGKVMP